MRISLNWLREYIDVADSPQRLAGLLTMQGLEVESIEEQADVYSNFVVGAVTGVEKHPQADQLSVCTVNVGKSELQIVCGAPNVRAGQRVPVGLVGAVVPHDQHSPTGESFELTRVSIRGVESFGMICSPYELGLGDDKSGIMILSNSARVGESFADHMGMNDVILEVAITPNRSDAMSHIGIAREIGVFSAKRLRFPAISLRESRAKTSEFISVEVASPIDCPRYTARILRNVTVGESPDWLKKRLRAIGIRPINNIVDVTNYVLMEVGQPLHAFDYDKLSGRKIVVRRPKGERTFTTLDGKSRQLAADMLLICDAERPIAIAGVMGGENSEISRDTKSILIESAYFLPQSVRKTSKVLGVSTDASQRFERGMDPLITGWAADRAAILIQKLCGGEILSGSVDVYPKKIIPRRVTLGLQKTNALLGTTLSKKRALKLLSKLEIKALSRGSPSRNSDKVVLQIPTFRPDLEREVDVIEEVARIHGYDNIETKTRTTLSFSSDAPESDLADQLRSHFSGCGFYEAIANSMQEESVASLASSDFVRIANPISKDMAALRTSLIPGILEIIRNNIYHGTKSIRLFELGKAYHTTAEGGKGNSLNHYLERDRLLVAMVGLSQPVTWSEKPRFCDIFDLRGEIELMFKKIFLDKYKFIPYSTPTKTLTEQGLAIEINGESAGVLGSVSRLLLDRFEVEGKVFVAELDLGLVERNRCSKAKYGGLAKYPEVLRDIAIVVDHSVPVDQLEARMWSVGRPLLKAVTLFDVYVGERIDSSKKSCAFALEFQSQEKTLSQEEVDRIMQKMITSLAVAYDAVLRT